MATETVFMTSCRIRGLPVLLRGNSFETPPCGHDVGIGFVDAIGLVLQKVLDLPSRYPLSEIQFPSASTLKKRLAA
jgi:hypothetical protein